MDIIQKFLFWLDMRFRYIRFLFKNKFKIIAKEKNAIKNIIQTYNLTNDIDIGEFITSVIKYKSDGFFDWQQFAFETLQKQSGDCEDIHRVAQLLYSDLYPDQVVYLVNVLTKPYNKSHAFVLIYNPTDLSWGFLDYNNFDYGFKNIDSTIEYAMTKYGIDYIISYTIFDEDWNTVSF